MTDKRVSKLSAALRTLDGTEGRPIARRNARKRVLFAMRMLRANVDAEFPAIVSRSGIKRLTPEGRIQRMKRAGWSPISRDSAFVADCALAGIKIRQVAGNIFAPLWAKHVWNDAANASSGSDEVTSLRAAKKNVKLRNAALAKAALLK